MKVAGNNSYFIDNANTAFNKIKSLSIKFNFYKVLINILQNYLLLFFYYLLALLSQATIQAKKQ